MCCFKYTPIIYALHICIYYIMHIIYIIYYAYMHYMHCPDPQLLHRCCCVWVPFHMVCCCEFCFIYPLLLHWLLLFINYCYNLFWVSSSSRKVIWGTWRILEWGSRKISEIYLIFQIDKWVHVFLLFWKHGETSYYIKEIKCQEKLFY